MMYLGGILENYSGRNEHFKKISCFLLRAETNWTTRNLTMA
jgi:hypothetical protein